MNSVSFDGLIKNQYSCCLSEIVVGRGCGFMISLTRPKFGFSEI